MKIDGATLEGLHANVTDLLQVSTKTKSADREPYSVNVGSVASVKTRLGSKSYWWSRYSQIQFKQVAKFARLPNGMHGWFCCLVFQAIAYLITQHVLPTSVHMQWTQFRFVTWHLSAQTPESVCYSITKMFEKFHLKSTFKWHNIYFPS